ncbi:hypothetical protein [Erythrobacter sp. F6033]|uniref:hypothetical protein n=1 Tax=Erythrobacter sp. F6033 TaxID=2926401 RepID=UPI001FF52844|nr:hypothetical protein [Erythrobacter sp. F6033]MCK0127690.1 hypothetical protein [Erythrobacter sp. F6033]
MSTTNVLEQNQFVIEADGTTDPDGDSITITMSQVAGPTATRLDDINALATRWRAPSLNQDETVEIQIEIRAEDGRGAVATQNVVIAVRGFSGPGRPVAVFDPGVRLVSGNVNAETNAGISEVIAQQNIDGGMSGDQERLLFFGEDSGFGYFDYSQFDRATLAETFGDVSFLEKGTLDFNFQSFVDWASGLLVASETDDEVSWFTTESSSASDRPFARRDGFSISNPCFVQGRVDTSQDFVWIGQRNQGLSVVRLDRQSDSNGFTVFNDALISQTSQGRSLCHLTTTSFAQRLYQPDFFNNSNFDNLLAIDYNTNELVLLGDSNEDQIYEELEVVPIDTQASTQLSIVDVFSRGTKSAVPRIMTVLVTDGTEGGQHRLIVITQDQDDEFVQTVFSWSGGVPVALLEGSFVGVRPNDQTRKDLVVVSATGQSLVFENTVPENSGAATPPTYAAPVIFDTGIGAGSAVTARDENFADDVVMVSYPTTGVVRVFKPSELISN